MSNADQIDPQEWAAQNLYVQIQDLKRSLHTDQSLDTLLHTARLLGSLVTELQAVQDVALRLADTKRGNIYASYKDGRSTGA